MEGGAAKAFLRAVGASSASPTIDGRSIYLRQPSTQDFPQWSALRAESRTFLQPWEPRWPEDDLSRISYRRRLKRYARETRNDRGFPCFLFKKSDDCLVGGLTLSNIRRGVAQSCSLGYWMGQHYAGQGYMRDAVEAVLPYVFGKMGLHRLEAACLPHNERSIGLLNATGFTKEGYARGYLRINGQWQDHVLFAITKEDWKNKPGYMVNGS
ncbi:MAG: GNAT family protein [Stappiaceae bacterium]